ncbi:hypothetical protein SAY87_000074 [Trapa incisa]|uniref:Uncharacterized protein n=1 Tax=Trapa incisa TaxID=236973 RepID=A0AAN7JGW4_9MYRT|nr:hypothetical protein SAY87_000074 [Trapa incisa]
MRWICCRRRSNQEEARPCRRLANKYSKLMKLLAGTAATVRSMRRRLGGPGLAPHLQSIEIQGTGVELLRRDLINQQDKAISAPETRSAEGDSESLGRHEGHIDTSRLEQPSAHQRLR